MMKYTSLRSYMKKLKNKLYINHCLEHCDLVIDGDSYFNHFYKNSGCEFVYGAECDKYAEYLMAKLHCFIDNNVKCYVVFHGCTITDDKKRQEAHQRIIDNRSADAVSYFEPVFADDVLRDVLKEKGIKYFYCEGDAAEAIVSVARKFKCPVLTGNIEYCLYGVSCIPPGSLEVYGKIHCHLYEHSRAKSMFCVYDKTPLFLTLLNENGDHFGKLADIIECEDDKIVTSALRWVKKQRKDAIQNVTRKLDDETKRKAFMALYEKIDLLCNYSQGTLAVKHFLRDEPYALFKHDKKWFSKGVSNGRIAAPYVGLKKNAMFAGSHLMFDANKPDAMLAAIDIISFSCNLLTNSQNSEFTLMERKLDSCCAVKKEAQWGCKLSNWPLFTERKKCKEHSQPKLLKEFLRIKLPYFDMDDLNSIPINCRTLVISLVYYVSCVNKDFEVGAYCVLLSYVLLNPVAAAIRIRSKVINSVIEASLWEDGYDFIDNALAYEDCQAFSNALGSFFQTRKQLSKLDRTLLHTLSEFQHCMQHMNNLVRLGDKGDPPCTVYHRAYNGTFVYNLYVAMNSKRELMDFLERRFKTSPVLKLYRKIVNFFESSLK